MRRVRAPLRPPRRPAGGPFTKAPAPTAARRPEPTTATVPVAPSGAIPSTIVAVADIGSISVHLLVAEVAGHRLTPLVDESVFLGLGSAVADTGVLGRPVRTELLATLVHFAEAARGLGATDVTLLGTEPIRRAADGPSMVHEVEAATSSSLHVLTHEEEAYLTIIGVTEGRPVTERTLVVDVGGGSSEFCVVDARRAPRAAGLRLGSARLTDLHVNHDPVIAAEIDQMRTEAKGILRAALDVRPDVIIAVGGTASNLIKILPAALLDGTLTHDRIAQAQAILAAEPASVTAERHLMNPVRARILPAGGAILEALMDRYGVDQIQVAEAGIREGAALVTAHAGRSWRDRLARLARGWRTETD